MEFIHLYHVFQKHEMAKFDRHREVINTPPGYQKMRVHLVFAIKYSYDGRHKARLVADGHSSLKSKQLTFLQEGSNRILA